jgi:hypothetical protein
MTEGEDAGRSDFLTGSARLRGVLPVVGHGARRAGALLETGSKIFFM